MKYVKAGTMRYLKCHQIGRGQNILYSQITSHHPSIGGIEIQIHDGDATHTKCHAIAPTIHKGSKSRI